MNKISIIGSGYVGLVTGICMADFGFNVICMDSDLEKINRLKKNEIPIYEPGLKLLLDKNYLAGRITFTSDMEYAVMNSNVIFIAVGTPPQEDGSADLSHVMDVATQIANYMNDYKVIVNKSTVPVGTAKKVSNIIKDILNKRGEEISFDVISNPEFLREGAAVKDFMHPDRIVIGGENKKAIEIVKNLYKVLFLRNTPFILTNWETSELTKYATNAFLATKISFINEISNLCDNVGANVQDIASAMGLDGRISPKFLHPGPGYGGSCFPKDTKALVNIGNTNECELYVVKAAIEANAKQRIKMVEKIEKLMGNIKGKVFSILGLSFKPETDDIREAPAIFIINELVKRGAIIVATDPIAIRNARTVLGSENITLVENEYEAVQDADAIIVLTEWNQYRRLDLANIKDKMKGNFFFDFRNIYTSKEIENYGFIYEGVGTK